MSMHVVMKTKKRALHGSLELVNVSCVPAFLVLTHLITAVLDKTAHCQPECLTLGGLVGPVQSVYGPWG